MVRQRLPRLGQSSFVLEHVNAGRSLLLTSQADWDAVRADYRSTHGEPLRLRVKIEDRQITERIPDYLRVPVAKLRQGRSLGSGGYGDVYLAEYFGSQVAVKWFRMSSADVERDFVREFTILQASQHANIVRLMGACSTTIASVL